MGSVAGGAVKHAAPGVGGQGSGGEPGEMLVAFSQPEELHDLLSMCELPLVPGGRSLRLPLLLSLLLFVIYLITMFRSAEVPERSNKHTGEGHCRQRQSRSKHLTT